MKRKLVHNAFLGAVFGMAANYGVAVVASYALGLGYLMPYPAILPERVGGEMNAVLLMLVLCAAIGMAVGIAVGLLRVDSNSRTKRNNVGITAERQQPTRYFLTARHSGAHNGFGA